jgi:hypothetical protein
VEVAELAGLGHDFLLDEERWLIEGVLSLVEESCCIANKGIVEEYTRSCKEVSPVSSYFLASLRVVASDSFQNLVMVEPSPLVSDLDLGELTPCLEDGIVVLVVADGNRVVNKISD